MLLGRTPRRTPGPAGGMILLAFICLAAMSGCGGTPTGASRVKTVRPPRIATAYFVQAHTKALVNAKGRALYIFVPDKQRAVTCTGSCALTWPPVYAATSKVAGTHPAAAGKGVKPSLLGSDPDPGANRVVTYNRWPLYAYATDNQPGVATGQGINLNGGYWYLIRPDGVPIVPPNDPKPVSSKP